MKRLWKFGVLLGLALPVLALAACNGETPETTTTNAPPAEEPNVVLELAKGGATEYTIVYDDGNDDATQIANAIESAFSKKGVEINSVAASVAEADYGKEIVVGNIRGSAADPVAKMKYRDFAACVSGDDWVLVATDATNYKYLKEVIENKVLDNMTNEGLTVESKNDLICSSSTYADVTYAEYLQKSSRTLELDTIKTFFTAKTYSSTGSDRTRLPYQLYVPSNYDPAKKYPVLIFLHGAGERGSDNDAQFVHVVSNLFNMEDSPVTDAIVIVPQCPNGNQWVDTPWANGSYSTSTVKQSNESKAVMAVLDKVAAAYSTDTDRYYVMGISMGGFGTWDLVMRYPDKFAAAVPICGGADPSMATALKDFPIYTTHDANDPTVPVSGTREMVEALQAAGNTSVIYEESTGKGHGVWDDFTKRPEVINWLFDKKLSDRK